MFQVRGSAEAVLSGIMCEQGSVIKRTGLNGDAVSTYTVKSYQVMLRVASRHRVSDELKAKHEALRGVKRVYVRVQSKRIEVADR
jgi:hypothetical protein